MENKQNIKLKSHEEMKNSELIAISNRENEYKINTKLDNELNIIDNNEHPKIKTEDKLYGNDFIKCYLTNKDNCIKKFFCSKIKKMGQLYVFFFINNKPIIVLGNKNLHYMIIYEVFIHISFIIFKYLIMNEVDPGMKYSLTIIYIVSFICHIIIILFNPGFPSIDRYTKIFLKSESYLKMDKNAIKDYYVCETCNIVLKYSEKVEHCEDCDICVRNYDHHCYWTGKCITKRTLIFFYGFAFGSLFYILWYFIIIIYWLLLKISKYNTKK